jgi:hypothetical protein
MRPVRSPEAVILLSSRPHPVAVRRPSLTIGAHSGWCNERLDADFADYADGSVPARTGPPEALIRAIRAIRVQQFIAPTTLERVPSAELHLELLT